MWLSAHLNLSAIPEVQLIDGLTTYPASLVSCAANSGFIAKRERDE